MTSIPDQILRSLCHVSRTLTSWTRCPVQGLVALLLLLIACAQADLHAPCMGCRLFNLENRRHQQNKQDTTFCHYPCQCPREELACHEGVSIVKDGCSCCYMCARQMGDMCSKKDLCDTAKGLYCDRKDDNSTGICKGRDKKPCLVAGVQYQDGEKFQPECSQLCTCQNGFYGCVNTCPQELQKPSDETCHEPKLIKVPNKCCREWTCQKMEATGNFSKQTDSRGLKSQNLIMQNPMWYRTSTESPDTTEAPENLGPLPCDQKTTDWTPCPVTCGVGVSMRIVVDPLECTNYKEHQLCFLRPCEQNLTTLGRDKCTPTTRSKGRLRIHYQDCLSIRDYRLKFCTNCKQNKCCYPRRTRTRTMEFQCSGGTREVLNFMWIKKCRCDRACYTKGDRRRRGRSRKGKKSREERRRARLMRKKKRKRNQT